jgi:hypothetical protein
MTKLKAALRKVLRTHLNTTSPSHESLLTSPRHYRRTDNIQRRRAAVTWCPTYSLGLSIEVGLHECVKNSLCHITTAIKMCCLLRDAHKPSHHTTQPSFLFKYSHIYRDATADPTFRPTEDRNTSVLSDENKSDKKSFPIGEAAWCQV